jgi:hypothetical protein
MKVNMETEPAAAKLPENHAELDLETEASPATSPLDAEHKLRGPLRVLGVFLIIFNVW